MERRLFLILLSFTTLIMVGCNEEMGKTTKIEQFKILQIDSCEYLKTLDYYGIAHKGNCRFCKKRRQGELKELVEQLKEK